MTIPKEGKCRVRKYCNWKVVLSNREVQKEVCRYCGKQALYKHEALLDPKENGRYIRAHIRDFCQPFGPSRGIYIDIYGMEPIKQAEENRKIQKQHEDKMHGYDDDFDGFMKSGTKSYF